MSRAFTKERDDAPEPVQIAKREEPQYEPPEDRTVAGFGATVHVGDGSKLDAVFTIVADSAADVTAGKIGMTSPLAQALLGARAGDRVIWERPIGKLKLRVLDLRYDP
ncbi:MAG: GreA/GreB family elongation factor [Candidatus Eremiobacteraeota bacterium]|nr:GreA/GreB family elongation factor [Candidatus Eremiobacteraeota bacterium]